MRRSGFLKLNPMQEAAAFDKVKYDGIIEELKEKIQELNTKLAYSTDELKEIISDVNTQ